jgi:hypothetical protein
MGMRVLRSETTGIGAAGVLAMGVPRAGGAITFGQCRGEAVAPRPTGVSDASVEK